IDKGASEKAPAERAPEVGEETHEPNVVNRGLRVCENEIFEARNLLGRDEFFAQRIEQGAEFDDNRGVGWHQRPSHTSAFGPNGRTTSCIPLSELKVSRGYRALSVRTVEQHLSDLRGCRISGPSVQGLGNGLSGFTDFFSAPGQNGRWSSG